MIVNKPKTNPDGVFTNDFREHLNLVVSRANLFCSAAKLASLDARHYSSGYIAGTVAFEDSTVREFEWYAAGDLDNGFVPCGQCHGIMNDLLATVREVTSINSQYDNLPRPNRLLIRQTPIPSNQGGGAKLYAIIKMRDIVSSI